MISENYSTFNNSKCLEGGGIQFLNDYSLNFLEKCTNEIKHIQSNCSYNNYKNKTFNFSFVCSEKFP